MTAEIVRSLSHDAFSEWPDEMARYDDLGKALASAQRRGSVTGVRFLLANRRPGDNADRQRRLMADAVVRELKTMHDGLGPPVLVLFDTFWKEESAVNRKRGGNRLVGRGRQAYGFGGHVMNLGAVHERGQIRWSAVLELSQQELPGALAAMERDDGAVLLPSTKALEAVPLVRDLFADEDGTLTTRPLWPLWTLRRTQAGDGVVLAGELNDHSGRQVFLLTR